MDFGEYHFKTSAVKAAAMDDFHSSANSMPSSDYIHPGDDDACWLDDDDESIGAFRPKLSDCIDADTLRYLGASILGNVMRGVILCHLLLGKMERRTTTVNLRRGQGANQQEHCPATVG